METIDKNLPRYWIKPYYSSFDGIRAVAILMVFINHFGEFWHADKVQSFTWVGVDLFFVLSGFLITGILYDSLDTMRYFHNFYVRRALRIFPVYYGFFLLLFLLTPIFHLHYTPLLLLFPLYVGNLVVPWTNLPLHNPTMVFVLRHGAFLQVLNIGHFWSLCVEEQFYLIWPAVLWFVRDRRKLMRLCIIVSVLTLLGRFYLRWYHLKYLLITWSTYTRWDTLLVGAWLALWLRGTPLSLAKFRRISFFLFWMPFVALVLGVTLFMHTVSIRYVMDNKFISTVGYTLIALCGAGIVMRSLDETSLLSRAMRFPPLRSLGRISYGFYIVQNLFFAGCGRVAERYPHTAPYLPFAAFLLALCVASISFRYLEKPFLELKNSLAPQGIPSQNGVAPHLHVSEPNPNGI